MPLRRALLALAVLTVAAACQRPPAPGSSAPGPQQQPAQGAAPAAPSQKPQHPASTPADGGLLDFKRPPPRPTRSVPNMPAPTLPPESTPETGGGEPQTLLLKDSGVRCITFPCPSYSVQAAGKEPGAPRQVHELDLSALGSDAERERVQEGVAQGLRVEGTLSVRRKAGPAGDATVLKVTRLLK